MPSSSQAESGLDVTITTTMPEDGVVIIPANSALAVLGGVIFLGGQIFMYASDRIETKSAIAALERQDAESRGRGDDIRRRLANSKPTATTSSDRLSRVEEKISTQTELLREIRDELKKRPDR
jgi:hypothetical protein